MNEQRKHPRHCVRWQVALRQGSALVYGETLDLSVGGASVLIDRNIPAGTVARFFLKIPSRRPGVPGPVVEAEARILYTAFSAGHDRWRLGLQFLKLKSADRQLLDREFSALA